MATNETISSSKCGKKYRGGHICAAVNCHNRTYNSSLSLFKFLRQKERYNLFNSSTCRIYILRCDWCQKFRHLNEIAWIFQIQAMGNWPQEGRLNVLLYRETEQAIYSLHQFTLKTTILWIQQWRTDWFTVLFQQFLIYQTHHQNSHLNDNFQSTILYLAKHQNQNKCKLHLTCLSPHHQNVSK